MNKLFQSICIAALIVTAVPDPAAVAQARISRSVAAIALPEAPNPQPQVQMEAMLQQPKQGQSVQASTLR